VRAATTTATSTSPEGQDEDGREKEVEKGIGRDQVCSLFFSARVLRVCAFARARFEIRSLNLDGFDSVSIH
jgi:hypothetical protein